MKERPYDIAGYVTKNDILCSDGRIIRQNAFIDNDGEEVPMVYQHNHSDPENILGHARLENRKDGVYGYCWFNRNPKAQAMKEAVANGDIKAFSIFANQLKQRGSDVIHGMIREVSLVLSPANKGARIENLNFAHSDGTYEVDDEEALIYTDDQEIEVYHDGMEENEEEETMAKTAELDIQAVLDSMNEDQQAVVRAFYEQGQIDALEDLEHSEDDDEEYESDEEEDEEEDSDDFEDEEDEDDEEDDEIEHSNMKGTKKMKKNVFDNSGVEEKNDTLSHAEITTIFTDAKRMGSLKEAVLSHSAEYGIDQIDWLFPEYKNNNNPPEFIKRGQEWVQKVMNGVHNVRFTRVKSMFADITEDDARALGYIKGHRKKEEVFTLLKRTTDPQTIYKKQKLDRDDVIDITDFDVVSWLKGEMRMMLDEEIARAILIGDGRPTSSDDSISQQHVRSIWKDDDLFTVKVAVAAENGVPPAKTLIKKIIYNRMLYKGSGNPTLFTTESVLSQMLLLEDGIGHFLYPNKDSLATMLRVADIVTVPVFEVAGTRTETSGSTATEYDLLALMVNLNDYQVGADNGGSVNMFDDFDIDYNQQKYLIETRISGALVKPFSALAFEAVHSDNPFIPIDPSMPSKPWAKQGGSVYPQPTATTGSNDEP